jgi:hypothetical protein
MTTLERVETWKQNSIISDSQHQTIYALLRKQRFSLFVELNALLYLGVVSIAGGLGWTFKTYFTNLGDAFIISLLSAMLIASLYYCFTHARPFAATEVEAPNLVFDYVLYFACLVLAVEIGYIEFRFQLLQSGWDTYLLFSAIVFFLLSYRFDNRFVLSLALSSLAGWFGFRVSRFNLWVVSDSLRLSGFAYGVVVVSAGEWFRRLGLKKHFFETYLHVGANAILLAAVSGISNRSEEVLYLLLLLVLCGMAIGLGSRFRAFAFVVYGIVYGYIGLSIELLRFIEGDTAALTYFVVTGTIVVASIAILARRFGREV